MDKTEYKAGENLQMIISHCKYMDLPATLGRQYVNHIIYTLPSIDVANSPKGCATRKAIDVNIPEQLPPGSYYYHQTMIYRVNPIREVTVVFDTPIFEIIE